MQACAISMVMHTKEAIITKFAKWQILFKYMKKRVSLKDIAEKVGVSIALVSYVLNGKKIGRIGKDITQKIKAAALEMNYSGNAVARSLKTRKTFTIGLIVADISNIFWSSLARIIEDEAEKSNYTVLFGSSDEKPEKSDKLIQVLLNHQVDGFIIAPAENSIAQLTSLIENEIPFVLIDRYFPEVEACHVAINNYGAAYKLVKHVVDEGFKRIGLIIFESSLFHLQERRRGYLSCLHDNQILFKSEWIKEVNLEDTRLSVAHAIDKLLALPEPIEAILFATNELSSFGLRHINTLSIKVPNDLAIISFDESDAADLFYAPVTYMKQPLKQIGALAIKTLLECFENNKISKINLDAEFVKQKSSLKKSLDNRRTMA